MAKTQAYCLVEIPHSLVLPAEIAMELFPLLCHGEPVTYDWQNKTHKRVASDRDGCTIKQFTIPQYAQLALNSEPE
jgi:hypothetical protein